MIERNSVALKDIYTDVKLVKVETKPTGTVRTELKSYSELFAQDQNVNTEHIEGRKVFCKAEMGMGKTCLMQKITHDWVKGIFTVFTIVFFISMKLVKPGEPIENIIIDQNSKLKGLKVSPEKLRAVMEKFGSRCLLIVDGFDEADSNRDEILKILKGEMLLACSVIVTARPHVETEIPVEVPLTFEVLGFQEHKAKEYVSKRFQDKNKVKRVLKFLKTNFEQKDHKSVNPLIVLFVCFLAEKESIKLSRRKVKVAEVYFLVIQCIYVTFLNRYEKSFSPDDFKAVFRRVGTLAWQTLIKGQKFRQKHEILDQAGDDIFRYGFLVGFEDDQLQHDVTADIVVTFLHRTIEEFFVSFHCVDNLGAGHTVEDLLGNHSKLPILTN